jgi:four helix bundle protein
MSESRKEFYFSHEKLIVYQKSLEFIKWVHQILSRINYHSDIQNQLERASNSILLNIAEGNGKFSPKDRCRFFDISMGSTLESSACIDILKIKKIINESEKVYAKELLNDIVSLLIGLIKSNSDRVYEDNDTDSYSSQSHSQS